MSKKTIIATLTILIVIISGVGYFYFTNNQTEEKNQNSTANSSTSSLSSNPNERPIGNRPNGGMPPGGQSSLDTSTISNKWTDVEYASKSASQKLDIYLPETGSGPFPVIISVHGGAFKSGDKASGELTPMLTGLNRGYAVVSVNYRLSSEAVFPAQINDIKAAIKFLRANSGTYKLDTENFAIWGGSAGGSLAALAGTSGGVGDLVDTNLGNSNESDKVQAVVDWFGPIYFSTMDEEFSALGQTPVMGKTSSANSPESAYLGKTVGSAEAQSLVEKASAQTYISSDDPAFYIQHGTEDRNIPITQSENLANKLSSVIGKEKVTFEKIEGAGHGGSQFETSSNLDKIFAFLDSQLK